MKSEGLQFFTDMHWPLIGFIIFFCSFFVLIILHMKTYGKGTLNRIERLPFEGESHEL
ncbi:MAG: hypothetical protein ACXWC9_07500 [Pseudobdellovibrionaceae bacterium]